MKDLKLDEHTGLVLEGGGMRGVFTCGVLDYLMDHDIRFPYAIGVSAGACNGLSYASRQRGRAKFSNIDLLEKYNYIGLKHLLRKRNILDFDLLFNEFPEHILPYDYDTYFASPERFVMVTTNCMTGEANYFEEKRDKSRVIDIVRASSSLPLFVLSLTWMMFRCLMEELLILFPCRELLRTVTPVMWLYLPVIAVTGKTRKISVFHPLSTGNIRSCARH